MEALDFAGVADDLKAYSRDNKSHIITRMLNPGINEGMGGVVKPIDYYMNSLITKDELVLSDLFFGDVLQPGGKDTFNPKGGAGFKTRIGKVRPVKIDVLWKHTQIMQAQKTYLHDCESKKIDANEVPFEAYVFDGIIKKANENYRYALMNGIYDATGTDVTDCFDGLVKVLSDAIVDGSIPTSNVIDIDAITDQNAVEQFEKMLDAVPDRYFYSSMVCLTNRKIKTAYERNYRKVFDSLPYNTALDKPYLVGSNIEFVVEPALEAYNNPIFVPKGLITHLYDNRGQITGLTADYDARTRSIAVVGDAQGGINIAAGELVWVGQA